MTDKVNTYMSRCMSKPMTWSKFFDLYFFAQKVSLYLK